MFAARLLPLLEPDDIVWVHDYHLIPLAAALRRAGARQAIGFFLHVPFPNFDVLRALPCYAELLDDPSERFTKEQAKDPEKDPEKPRND